MSNSVSPAATSWRGSRYGFAGLHLLALLFLWLGFRLALYVAFGPAAAPLGEVLLAFLSGLQRDLFVALALTVPLLGWMLVAPNSWRYCKWHRLLFWTGYFVFWFVEIFLLFVEFFFFEEFKSRFNTVAVDYIWYPHEVFVNIWESYHVGIVLAVCFGLSLGWVLILGRLFSRMWERPFSAAARMAYLVAGLAVLALLMPALNLKGAHVSADRTLNEIA